MTGQSNAGFRDPSNSLFSRLQQPTAEQARRQALMQNIAAQMTGQGAQNVGQGAGQLMAGLAQGLSRGQQPFPTAPGNARPSLMTGLANFFTGRQNGGLY